MKKVIAPILILLLAAFFAPALEAQDDSSAAPLMITLESAIEMALGRNPFHQASLETEAQAMARLRQATARFFPTLNATGTHTLKEKLMTLAFAGQEFEVDFTENYQAVLPWPCPYLRGGSSWPAAGRPSSMLRRPGKASASRSRKRSST